MIRFIKKLPLFEVAALLITLIIITGVLPVKRGLSMSTFAAILFIICISSKIFFEYSKSNKKLLLPARVLALFTIIISTAAIIMLALKFIPLNNLFETAANDISKPADDMALISAFSFLLIGIALYRLTLYNAERIFISHVFSLIVLFTALFSVISNLFHDNIFSRFTFYNPMGMITAVCFFLLAFSVMLVNRHKSFLGNFTAKLQGGRMARVMIPMAIIIPLLLGFFQLRSEQTGLYTHPYGVVLITLARIIILVLFIWWCAVILNRASKRLLTEVEERKEIEKSLRYRKALLEAQNEAIPDAVLVVGSKGKILSYNHQFATMWNIPQSIITANDDTSALQFATTQLANPDEFMQRVNYIYEHQEKTSHDEIEFKDGRIIERFGNVVIGEDGIKYGWAWYFRDITLNKNYERKLNAFNKDLEEKVKERTEELHQRERRFRSLLENAHDIISLSDGKGKFFYVSPSIERITGYSIRETLDTPVFEFVHPDDVEHGHEIQKEFIKRPGEGIYILFRYKHKSGKYIWLEGTVRNLLGDENVKAVVGNFHDVTERKIAEEKLSISNERFQMVSRATNDALWDWNLETDKIYWNEEIKSMFGYSPDDIATGTGWKIHIYKEDFSRVTKKLLYHIKNNIQNWQDEYRFLCADGSYKYVFNRGFILFDKNQKPYRIIGAMQDVTQINKLEQSLSKERIKKQQELIRATIQGQEKERTEIGKELHDNINQLLTATKLYLDVAISQPKMKDEMIQRSVDNVKQCMDEIRKLSSALVPPSIGINNFNDIIKDLIEPIKLAASIHIQYKISHLNANELTGEQQLNVYRIVQEHLNNILKHSKATNVLISIKQVENEVIVKIKDDGEGFNVNAKRTGIGFKNIQSRAQLLSGKIKIASKPGEGCTLSINFPLNFLTV